MQVQWFPGHMHKTLQALKFRLKHIDLVLELLDARLPGSSSNPLIEHLSAGKIKLKLLNKADLADEAVTVLWLNYFNNQKLTQTFAVSLKEKLNKRLLLERVRALLPYRGGMHKPLRILVCGVPNVGKSFFINILLGRAVTKTGDEAGITKEEQRLLWKNDVWIYDTPGMLWKKISPPESGYRLAGVGSIGKNAYEVEAIALHLWNYLQAHYWPFLRQRYQLNDELKVHNYLGQDYLTLIARSRGALLKGGMINYQKAAELLIQDIRDGKLGRISLERPEEWINWVQRVQ